MSVHEQGDGSMRAMSGKIYTLDELRAIVLPLADKRDIARVSVFGSYARHEADEHSDIDLLVDREGGRLLRILGLGTEVEEATGKSVDIYDVSELLPGDFRDAVLAEAVAL